jgi:hypothetical protein
MSIGLSQAEVDYLFKHGTVLKYHRFGVRYIIKYKDRWYKIGYSGLFPEPEAIDGSYEITEEDAKYKIALTTTAWTKRTWRKAQKLFNWEPLEEYIEKRLEGAK